MHKKGDCMGKRVVKAVKEGLSVLVLWVVVAIIFNFFKMDFGYNRFWTYLGNFEIINFFNGKALNGLIVLSFLLGLIVFVLSLSLSDKKIKK